MTFPRQSVFFTPDTEVIAGQEVKPWKSSWCTNVFMGGPQRTMHERLLAGAWESESPLCTAMYILREVWGSLSLISFMSLPFLPWKNVHESDLVRVSWGWMNSCSNSRQQCAHQPRGMHSPIGQFFTLRLAHQKRVLLPSWFHTCLFLWRILAILPGPSLFVFSNSFKMINLPFLLETCLTFLWCNQITALPTLEFGGLLLSDVKAV